MFNLIVKVLLFYLIINKIVKCENNSTRIVIIGGGASGIATASRLFYHNYTNVQILEASNQLGGRIRSVQINENIVELGAEWIFSTNNNIVSRIAKENYLLRKCATFKGGRTYFKTNGTIIIQSPQFTDFLDILRKAMLHQLPDESMSAYMETRLNQSTVKLKCAYNQFDSWHDTGYDTLLEILLQKYAEPSDSSSGIPVDIKLNTEVKKINYDGAEIVLDIVNDLPIIADKVIVTVPLGYLQENYRWYKFFNPKLSMLKADAIKSLKFTTVNKVFLQFDTPWWTSDYGGFTILWSQRDFEELTGEDEWLRGLVAILRADNHPDFLVAYIYGKYAEDYEKISKATVTTQLMDIIREFVTEYENITEPIYTLRSKWHSEKFIKGSFTLIDSSAYSYIDIESLAAPIKNRYGDYNLYFAGEATNTNCGTVHGAVESGFRAADELVTHEIIRQELLLTRDLV